MKVTLIGMGCGPETLTAEASGALAEADLCVGAARLLGYRKVLAFNGRNLAE